MSKYAAYGAVIARGNGASPEVFTTIGQVSNIDGPSLDSEALETTDHASGGYKEFIQGLKEAGEITLDIDFDPNLATHKDAAGGLINDWKGGLVRNYKLTFPVSPAVNWTIPAFVKSFKQKAEVAGKLSAQVVLKCSGTPTLA